MNGLRIDNYPLCGFGNKLLFYVELVQKAKELGVEYVSCYEHQLDYALLDFRYTDDNSLTFDSFTHSVIPGSTLFREYHRRLDSFLTPKHDYSKLIAENSVGVHFRGGDYRVWRNGSGIPPYSYYENAFRQVVENNTRPFHVHIFSNDIELPAYKTFVAMVRDLSASNPEIVDSVIISPNNMYESWFRMAQCGYLICPPSTYNITAGMIGRPNKKIIQWAQWRDWRIDEGQTMWIDMASDLPRQVNHEYQVWKFI